MKVDIFKGQLIRFCHVTFILIWLEKEKETIPAQTKCNKCNDLLCN